MAYSVKKAGVGFKVKIETSADFTGQAGGFSAYYINDATGIRTDIVGSFVEDSNTPGLYFSPMIVIPTAGDYTMVVNNGAAGMDNHPTPIVVTNATIDDVKVVVDGLEQTIATVAADVDGLNGQDLADIKATIASIETLVNDNTDVAVTISGDATDVLAAGETATGTTSTASGTVSSATFDGTNTQVILTSVSGIFQTGETVTDGSTVTSGTITIVNTNNVNSVLEFVRQINEALLDGGNSLATLSGFTDDIENMLTGSQYLTDGSTPNPFYDAANPGVAKESTLTNGLTSLQSDISVFRTSLETKAANIQTSVNAVKDVVDANATALTDAGYGLDALRVLITNMATNVQTHGVNITSLLADSTSGLAAIKTEIVTRFDAVDGSLESLHAKVDTMQNTTGFKAFA